VIVEGIIYDPRAFYDTGTSGDMVAEVFRPSTQQYKKCPNRGQLKYALRLRFDTKQHSCYQ